MPCCWPSDAAPNKKVQNPIANVDSKQPDKVLFDRAMDAMKHNKYDVARLSLQTLINTYPDSEYVARAKLAIGDSWYAEGGSAALTQAENEYKDFITFFPNMPEAAEAQMKIANIHYQEMEKADRDSTHALRAEDEYRQLILQFPDSKLVPEAKQRLLRSAGSAGRARVPHRTFYYMRHYLGEVIGKDIGGTAAIGAVNDDDGLIGKVDPRVRFGNRGIIPAGDLTQEYTGQGLRGELQFRVHAGNVVGRNHRAQHGWNVQDLGLGLGQLLVGHGAIAGAEVHSLRQDLTNAAAAADRLVVELDIRMGLVVFAEPLLVHRIRKSSACPIQSCLAESR